MSSPSSSTIRAFVQFKEPTVFAGEDIECTITFKNIAPAHVDGRTDSRNYSGNGFAREGQQQHTKALPLQTTARPSRSASSPKPSQPGFQGHRSMLSLNISHQRPPKPQLPKLAGRQYSDAGSSRQKHGRSVSIISIGSEAGGVESRGQTGSAVPKEPAYRHGRSASLHVMPNGLAAQSSSLVSVGKRSNQRSPLAEDPPQPSIAESQEQFTGHSQSNRPSLPGRNTTPSTPTMSSLRSKPSNSPGQEFKFPAMQSSKDASEAQDSLQKPAPMVSQSRSNSTRPPEGALDTLPQLAKVLPGASMDETPRSSVEFYSMSNHSNETLASDYVGPFSSRLLPRPAHVPRTSQLAPTTHRRPPETLMMGYAQIIGSFSLDGSLVNQGPFEEVKRKGVIGGQGGGGVVGIEKSKRENGLFGALGWGNIGESLGGILGAGEPSSIREMRGIASSKSIPLLTTPQSVLFVDIRPAPGESQSFSYSFTLPRGLPPSYRGRLMKVAYNLVIGIQRPGSASRKQIRHIEVPFRVLGSVDNSGEILGHDLMSPYIILRNQARTFPIAASPSNNTVPILLSKSSSSSLDDFLAYTTKLLDDSRDSYSGLLSPTDHSARRRSSFVSQPATAKEAIDLAILRSNQPSDGAKQARNRFEISRAGQRVAAVSLPRVAYRLGETVHLVVEFAFPTTATITKGVPSSPSSGSKTAPAEKTIPPDLRTYAVTATLESYETIDPALSLRSEASIARATRKIHAVVTEKVMWARRAAFSAVIPASGTPEFITTGVSGGWLIRIEFVVLKQRPREDQSVASGGAGGESHEGGGQEERRQDSGLLEVVERDERGVVMGAVERVEVESFEVTIPIRVYGAPVVGGWDSGETEGLVV